MVLAAFAAALRAQDAPLPPAMLVEALETETSLTIIPPGAKPAWLQHDMDRDRRPDVVAVVSRKTPGGVEYGVVAVHARSPRELHWVMPLDIDVIHGVVIGPAPDTLIPLFCVDCDSNIWLRWSGEEYEPQLYAPGETIEIGGETQADIPLYSSPNLAAKPSGSVPHCTSATVNKVAGTPADRWYFVASADGQKGWVSARAVSPEICAG